VVSVAAGFSLRRLPEPTLRKGIPMDLVPDKYKDDDDPPPRRGRRRSAAGGNAWFWPVVLVVALAGFALLVWGLSSGNDPGVPPVALTTRPEPPPETRPSTTVKEPSDRVPTSREQPPPPPPPPNNPSRGAVLKTEQGANAVTLKWDSPIGPGQVRVPVLAPPPEEDGPALPPITRLVAVTFTPDGRDLLFLGTYEPGKPVLDPQELFDAFVVSLRALAGGGEPPGVSIDPTPEQAAGKIDEKSRMPVRYLGGDAGTTLGLVAFEADRILKCLSLGKNNLDGQPFGSSVPGYLSRTARLDNKGKKASADVSWDRFWIAVKDSQVSPSADGRTFFVQTRLFVDTRRMSVDAQGKLHDAREPAEPTAQQFSDHISENYEKYADQFPVLHRLHAFAQLTAVAQAVLGEPDKKEGTPLGSTLDLSWLLYGYPLPQVATPVDTPATVALGTAIKLTGGVDLTPKNQYRKGEGKVEELERAARAERPNNPAVREWTAHAEGKEWRVSARGPVAWGTPRLTQTDLRVGDLELVRDWSPANPDSPLGRGWSWRLVPQVSISRTIVDLKNGPRKPATVTFQDRPDRVVTMRPATLRLPGQPEVLGYASADGKHGLHPFKNDFVYLEGDIKWLEEQPSGRFRPEMGPDARIVHFTPDETAPHVREIETPQGTILVEHEDGLPVQIRNKAGQSIKLVYDTSGRGKVLREARGSDGQVRTYHHDSHGDLVRVDDDQGRGISYHPSSAPGRPLQVLVDVGADARAETASLPQAEVRTLPADMPARETAARPTIDARIAVVDARSAGEAELNVHADVVLQGADSDGTSVARLRGAVAPDAGEVLVVRNPDVCQALKEVLLSEVAVIGTSNLERAAVKLRTSLGQVGQGEVIVLDGDNTLAPVQQALGKVASTADARVAIVAGHMDARSAAQLRRLIAAGKFKDRAVILATCGVEQTRGLVEELIEAGALRVWSFEQTIPQKSLPGLVERIQQQLENGKQLDGLQNIRRSFRYGIKDTFKKNSELPMSSEQVHDDQGLFLGCLNQAA
jgi:hypothetical protein